MASSLATTSTVTKATAVSQSNDVNYKHRSLSNLSFARSLNPNLRFLTSTGLQHSRCSTVVKSQLKEVRLFDWFSLEDIVSYFRSILGIAPTPGSPVPFKVPADEPANSAPPQEDSPSETEESISEFLSQVASLVKLVDSRDIVELKLKQYDCEVLIRKKEAIPQPQPPPPPPAVNYGFPPPYMSPPPSPAPPPPMPVSASPPMPASPASLPAPKLSDPSRPPLKSPMAGTFYRSPAPGVPPFVKIGDKVQKGQVVCIVEAMKLMNEIEADQSGTIVEIIAEDGKPVSVNTPLLVIQP